ncbi:hypothetical protein HNY73_003305 [Argiope bruennichi]|uniref:Uncharacterized protein n=1 Tax=Argiope bruennichi TaxID=94029 RepID=A0A8T0G0H4_ARGBR|nr:hypothetical protein HNY73_003305 [Argiope bruennichi]
MKHALFFGVKCGSFPGETWLMRVSKGQTGRWFVVNNSSSRERETRDRLPRGQDARHREKSEFRKPLTNYMHEINSKQATAINFMCQNSFLSGNLDVLEVEGERKFIVAILLSEFDGQQSNKFVVD